MNFSIIIFLFFFPSIFANPFDIKSRTINELSSSTIEDSSNFIEFMMKNVNRGCVRKKLDSATNGHKRLDDAIGIALLVSSGLVCFSEDKFLFDFAVDKMTNEFIKDKKIHIQLHCLKKKLRQLESELDSASEATSSEEKDCDEFERNDNDLVQTISFKNQLQPLDLDDCVLFSADEFRALIYRLAFGVFSQTGPENVKAKSDTDLEEVKEKFRSFVHREAKKTFECFMTKV